MKANQMKTGKWSDHDEASLSQPKDCPDHVWEAFQEPAPDWDWAHFGQYFIARLYDQGEEAERVLCKVILEAVK